MSHAKLTTETKLVLPLSVTARVRDMVNAGASLPVLEDYLREVTEDAYSIGVDQGKIEAMHAIREELADEG